MPLSSKKDIFGNLTAYKFCIRPTAQRLFGDSSQIKKNKTSTKCATITSNFNVNWNWNHLGYCKSNGSK